MRSGAAEVGDEAADLEVLELDGVCWREVVGHHDHVFISTAPRQLARLAHQYLEYALDHLHHVALALAQIGIVDLVELLDQCFHLRHQRPLGVALALANQIASSICQQRVG